MIMEEGEVKPSAYFDFVCFESVIAGEIVGQVMQLIDVLQPAGWEASKSGLHCLFRRSRLLDIICCPLHLHRGQRAEPT